MSAADGRMGAVKGRCDWANSENKRAARRLRPRGSGMAASHDICCVTMLARVLYLLTCLRGAAAACRLPAASC